LQGILPNGSVVAVKQLFGKTNQGIDEFLNEVVLLTGMKHRNLVSLKGCCIREQQRLLVYEYVDNHDIDHALLGKLDNPQMRSFSTLFQVLDKLSMILLIHLVCYSWTSQQGFVELACAIEDLLGSCSGLALPPCTGSSQSHTP
jgi:hypothetical protein